MFKNSVCSYPNRGHYGKSSYRGNCTGHIIRDFIESYLSDKNGLVADPSIGGGTSTDVAKELGVRFKGTDLRDGFNILVDDFSSFLQEPADLIWWHPPYANMIAYSGNQWGDSPNKWDMSNMSLSDFAESLNLALMNIHDACKQGGHYGVLMGNLRSKGNYYNLSSLVERVAPGRLVDEIIKIQHNCTSDTRTYAKPIVRIAHEKLLVFKRANDGSIFYLGAVLKRTSNLVSATWKTVVRRILQGKTMSLDAIYKEVDPIASQRANQHWQAKVRQVLQDSRYFDRVETGVYKLAV